MLVLTDAMHREERLEKMWRTLDLLRPEGNVLLIEEQEGICWVVPKEEVEPDNRTDRSTYGQDYANDAAAVKYLARAEMIVPLLDPGAATARVFSWANEGEGRLKRSNTHLQVSVCGSLSMREVSTTTRIHMLGSKNPTRSLS